LAVVIFYERSHGLDLKELEVCMLKRIRSYLYIKLRVLLGVI